MAPRGVLAIDVGSTETRSTLVCLGRDKIHKRVVENLEEAHLSSHGVNYHSSKVLVHDDRQPRYIGHVLEYDREVSSAKFLPYPLSRKLQKFMDQYPLLGRLLAESGRVEKADFHARLEDAFIQFLRVVFKSVKRAHEKFEVDGELMQIVTLALTIPSQWGPEFQEVYDRLFRKVFHEVYADRPDLAAHDIVVEFYTEAQALAHYIFHKALRRRLLGGGMPSIEDILRLSKTNAQLLIDCGGHNANSTLTTYFQNKDGSGALVELSTPQGAGGGSEMMIYHLLEELIAQYRIKYEDQSEVTQKFYQELKEDTIAQLQGIVNGAGRQIMVPCKHLQTGNPSVLTIESDMSKRAFEMGFKHVMNMVRKQLRELARIKSEFEGREHIVTIIVSGGSARHPEFIKWIESQCESLGIGEPVFTSTMDIGYGDSRIATGAGYASVTTPSIESFADTCAFGIQKCNVVENGDLDREDFATTIWTKERGVIPMEVVATGNLAEYRIVCQPLLGSFTEKLQTDRGAVGGECYDFLIIGTLPDCLKCVLEIELNVAKKEVALTIFCHPYSSARTATAREPLKVQVGPFKVHIQASTRSLLLDMEQQEVAKLVDEAIEPYRQGTTYVGLDGGDDSSDEDDYVDQDGPDSDDSSFEEDGDDEDNRDDDDDSSGDDHPLKDENHVDDEDHFGDQPSDDDDPFDDDDQPGGSRPAARIAATASRSRPRSSGPARGMGEAPAAGSSATNERASGGAPGPSSRVGDLPRDNSPEAIDDGGPGPSSDLDDFRQDSPPSSGRHEGRGPQSRNWADERPEVQTPRKRRRGMGHIKRANKFLANLGEELSGTGASESAVGVESGPPSLAVPGRDYRQHNPFASSSGQASSGPSTAASSQAARAQSSASASNKRAADAQPDDSRSQKRPRASDWQPSSANGGSGQNNFPGEPRWRQRTGSSSNQSPLSQRAAPPPPPFNQRPPRTWTSRIHDDLATPSRRSGGPSSSVEYPDRYRYPRTGPQPAAASGDASASGNVVHIPPPSLPGRPVDSSAASRNRPTATGHAVLGPLPIRSPNTASGSGSPFGPNDAAPGSAPSEAGREPHRPGPFRAPRTAEAAFAMWAAADAQASRQTGPRPSQPQGSQSSRLPDPQALGLPDPRAFQRPESRSSQSPGQARRRSRNQRRGHGGFGDRNWRQGP